MQSIARLQSGVGACLLARSGQAPGRGCLTVGDLPTSVMNDSTCGNQEATSSRSRKAANLAGLKMSSWTDAVSRSLPHFQ